MSKQVTIYFTNGVEKLFYQCENIEVDECVLKFTSTITNPAGAIIIEEHEFAAALIAGWTTRMISTEVSRN